MDVLLVHDLVRDSPMYVRRYARTIQGAFVKSSRSCEMVTSEVETMEVSRLEKSSPANNLNMSISKFHMPTQQLPYEMTRTTRRGPVIECLRNPITSVGIGAFSSKSFSVAAIWPRDGFG